MGGSGKASFGSARRKFRVQCSALTSWGMVSYGEYVCALSKAVAVTVVLAHIPWRTAQVGVSEEWGQWIQRV